MVALSCLHRKRLQLQCLRLWLLGCRDSQHRAGHINCPPLPQCLGGQGVQAYATSGSPCDASSCRPGYSLSGTTCTPVRRCCKAAFPCNWLVASCTESRLAHVHAATGALSPAAPNSLSQCQLEASSVLPSLPLLSAPSAPTPTASSSALGAPAAPASRAGPCHQMPANCMERIS